MLAQTPSVSTSSGYHVNTCLVVRSVSVGTETPGFQTVPRHESTATGSACRKLPTAGEWQSARSDRPMGVGSQLFEQLQVNCCVVVQQPEYITVEQFRPAQVDTGDVGPTEVNLIEIRVL